MSDEKTCEGHLKGFGQYYCGKPAKYEHNGKHYCGTHHPPKVEERRKERRERWKAELAAEQIEKKQRNVAQAERDRKAADYDRLAAENERLKGRLEELGKFLCDCKKQSPFCQCYFCTKQAQWAAEDAKR